MPSITLISPPLPFPDLSIPLHPRTPGLHASDVIDHLCLSLGHYDPSDSPISPFNRELGQALEHAIAERVERKYPGLYLHNPEIAVPFEYTDADGQARTGILYMTPDLPSPSQHLDWEIKLTRMSSANGPGSLPFWRYEAQLMTYLWGLSKHYRQMFDRGRLTVLFLNEWNRDRQMPTWNYQFTRGEMVENWAKIRNEAITMLLEGWTGDSTITTEGEEL